MAEHPQEREQEEPQSVAGLTTEIVVAYVTRNTIAPTDLGDLIGAVARTIEGLGREEPERPKPEPAVPVRRSVHDDHLVCLVCGEQHRTLRRHLDVAHRLTPEAYRVQFGLKPDYPMAAPGYSRQRAEMAKRTGLGQRGQASSRRQQPKPASCRAG
jgi:predicted transcriptional regulator